MPRDAHDLPDRPLRTAAVAAASGYSVQQVRDLERLGVIPAARRAANGYRGFSDEHLLALRAYRNFAAAVGPVKAREGLRELRGRPIDQAAALVNSFHVSLAAEREEALAAQHALHLISAEIDADPSETDSMTITELAGALRVRPSTLRFWEEAGLITPERVTTLRARRYPLPVIREARIVAALRTAGYGIPVIGEIIRSIRRLGDPGDARKALQSRLETIAQRTLALLIAGADAAALITKERARKA